MEIVLLHPWSLYLVNNNNNRKGQNCRLNQLLECQLLFQIYCHHLIWPSKIIVLSYYVQQKVGSCALVLDGCTVQENRSFQITISLFILKQINQEKMLVFSVKARHFVPVFVLEMGITFHSMRISSIQSFEFWKYKYRSECYII